MTRKVLGHDGRPASFEIVRRGDDNAIVVGQLAHDKVGILRSPDPNDNIHALVDQVHQAIGESEVG